MPEFQHSVNVQRAKMLGTVLPRAIFRIYTEDLNRDEIEKIVAAEFEDFTEIPAVGYFHGQKENSLVIEIVGRVDPAKVENVAEAIRESNRQQAVMVTEEA